MQNYSGVVPGEHHRRIYVLLNNNTLDMIMAQNSSIVWEVTIFFTPLWSSYMRF